MKAETNKYSQNGWIHYFENGVSCLIFAACVFYSIFYASFAEIFIDFKALNFPVFVGEILLILAAVIWLAQRLQFNPTLSAKEFIVLVYFVWVVTKALLGYLEYGPLALRNAALFYYPVFCVFGYAFYGAIRWVKRAGWFILIFIMLMLLLNPPVKYFYLSYLIIAIACLTELKLSNTVTALMAMLAVAIFIVSQDGLLTGSKSHLIALSGVVVFYCAVGFVFFKGEIGKWNYFQKASLIGFPIVFISFLLFTTRLGTIAHFDSLAQLYQEQEELIRSGKQTFQFQPIQPALFNKNANDFLTQIKTRYISMSSPSELRDNVLRKTLEHKIDETINRKSIKSEQLNREKEEEIRDYFYKIVKDNFVTFIEDINRPEGSFEKTAKLVAVDVRQRFSDVLGQEEDDMSDTYSFEGVAADALRYYIQKNFQRSVEVEYSNILFRYYIWRDMIEELIEQKAFFGFSFGHPQRSKSIEILGQARQEWSRDGWITPHNSFLHVIYRSGLIGILLIGILISLFIQMVKTYITKSSFKGIIFSSAFLYWMVLANFLVIFELPQNAIPFWFFFGLALAHNKELTLSSSAS